MPRKFKRIRTLLYDDQRLGVGELELLHTPALQRLYDLHQLGLTDRVYIDASHSRLHHVVGVLEQAEKLCIALRENLAADSAHVFNVKDEDGAPLQISVKDLADLVKDRTSIVRLIGLFHDLTHSPYGHTVEDEIGLTSSKHDEPLRQADAFYRLVCQYFGWLGTEFGREVPSEIAATLSYPYRKPTCQPKAVANFAVELLREADKEKPPGWELTANEVAEILGQMYCAMNALLHLELLHTKDADDKFVPKPEYDFQIALRDTLMAFSPSSLNQYRFVPRRDAFMLDLIGNTVCADLLDYAQRDSHFANFKMGYDADRIAENFTLVLWDANEYPGAEGKDQRERRPDDPFSGPCIRTAISLYSHKLRTDVPSELMNLLNVRFYVYERALYHPTKCAAGAMLGTALQLINNPARSESDGSLPLPQELQYVGDSVFLDHVYHAGRLACSAIREQALRVQPTQNAQPSQETSATMGWADRCAAMLHEKVMCPQVESARAIIRRWDQRDASEALESIEAGCDLLCRLTSRRYYRQVFRSLPNAHNTLVDRKSEQLAERFLRPDVRFKVQRAIEVAARLKRGSVVIHCPRINTAQKIANVLLFLSSEEAGAGEIRKLRDVGEMADGFFAAHQIAIHAVEEMYKSMWRLAVYVAPEYLERWPEIAGAAGRVILQEFDTNNEYQNERWQNDGHLVRELRQNYGRRDSGQERRGVGLSELDRLVASGALGSSEVEEDIKRATRHRAVLRMVLSAVGKEHLEKREERLLGEFVEQEVVPLESEDFLAWQGGATNEFTPQQADLEIEGSRHFKAGDMAGVIEKLRQSVKRFKDRKNQGT